MGKLIKFDHVNAHGDFPALLDHFNLGYEKTGAQLRLLCPFHDDTNPSLSITLEETPEAKPNTWHCFGCKNSGSIIDFAALHTGASLRDAAVLVAEVSNCTLAPAKTAKPKTPQKGRSGAKKTETRKTAAPAEKTPDGQNLASGDVSEANPPLKFTLPLDQEHPAVGERVPPGLALTFGLGVCPETSRSMMAGRLCVPIHDQTGALIAYAGRYLGDDPKEAKWLFPKGFAKQLCLYNAHRVAGARRVVLVEGFFDAIRLHGLGYPALALMGTDLAETQIALLRELGVREVSLLFDGDEPGKAAAQDVALRLCAHCFVQRLHLPEGDDPASAPEPLLQNLLR